MLCKQVFKSVRPRGSEDSISSSDSFRTAANESADIFDFLIDIFKYVDDTTVIEAVDTSTAVRHITTATPKAHCKARYTGLVATAVAEKASSIGMKVNCKKTQLLVISPPDGYVFSSHTTILGETVNSENSLKLLGFVFGNEPNVAAHVGEIKRKFRSRFWSLMHLRKSGFGGAELFKFFNIFIRPVIEYCSVIYHPMLTKKQSSDIERMQKQAAKLCFGWNKSYAVICAEQSIDTLETRRLKYIDSFITKTIDSDRFKDTWYPLREEDEYGIRNRRPFVETRTRTSRYYKSPLSFLRRRANDIATGET